MQLLIANRAFNDFEPGDIIAVVGDSHVWGREETLDAWTAAGRSPDHFPNPGFSVIQLPGEPVDPNLMDDDEDVNAVDADDTTRVHKRLWQIRLAELDRADRARIAPGCCVKLDRGAARALIRAKHGDARLPLDPSSDGDSVKRRTETRLPRRVAVRPVRR